MASYPPPYTPPPNDWKYQRQAMKEQARMQRDAARAQRDLYRQQMRAARRSSILGPVVLIAVGIVFLLIQTGRVPGYLVWTWYSRWWPLLLITAGVVILLEWTLDRFMQTDDQPVVRRSVGGGLWALLIFALLFGISSSAVRRSHQFFAHGLKIDDDSMAEFFGNKHEIDQPFTQAFPAGSTLTIDNPKGAINVSGTSDDGQMHLQLHRVIYTTSDGEANSKAQQLMPKFDTTGNQVSLTLPVIEGAQADITITVPTATPLNITANRGDIDISEIKAPVIVTSNHGDVGLSGITGAVTGHVNNTNSSFSAHSVTGPVNVEAHAHDLNLSDINGTVVANGEYFGSIHFSHISGAVNLHTGRDDFQVAKLDGQYDMNGREITTDQATGPLLLATHSRNLTLDRISGAASVTNSNGSIDLTSVAPLGNITIENRSGSVNVTVPEHSSFTYQTSTVDGNLTSDFPGVGQTSSNRRNGSSGTVGAGGPAIHITTSHGDIAIRKAFLSSSAVAPVRPVIPIAPVRPVVPKPEFESDSSGNSLYVGKDGVQIISGADGSKVIIGKDGLRITANADGSKVYIGKDGLRLNTDADGTVIYVGPDGLRFTSNADGSKIYVGKDGTRININADGTNNAIGPDGTTLSRDAIRDRLHQAQDAVRRAAQQRDNTLDQQRGRN